MDINLNNRKGLLFITTLLWVFTTTNLWATPGLETELIIDVDSLPKKRIGKGLPYIQDTDKDVTFEQITSRDDWQIWQKDSLGLGLSQSVYWIRFTINNPSNKRPIYLQLEYPLIDDIQLFEV